VSFEGSLETYPLVDLLQWIEHHHAGGRLTLVHPPARRILDLVAGKIVYASSTLARERLGTFLVEKKQVARPNLFEAFARHLLFGESLTKTLIDAGFLDESQLVKTTTELAEQIIFDSFRWNEARFEFDPDYRPKPLLHIHLSLEAQILAFRGAKQFDDSSRSSGYRRRGGTVEASALVQPTADDDTLFWRAVDRASSDDRDLSADDIRQRQVSFRAFLHLARQTADRPAELFPVFGEIAAMLHPRLQNATAPADFVLQLSALDPYLSANMLLLGNGLTTDRRYGISTPREALAATGEAAMGTLLTGMTAPTAAQRTSDDAIEALSWRSSLAQAVAAARLAEYFEIDREEAYVFGLLGGLGYGLLLPLVLEVPFPSRAFRLAAVEQLQPEIGRTIADRFALADDLSLVLSSSGQIDADSPPVLQLAFLAREFSPVNLHGLEWRGVGLEPQDLVEKLRIPPTLARDIREDSERIFTFLGLPF